QPPTAFRSLPMSTRLTTLTRRAGAAAAVAVISLLALAGPASAHVTVAADDSTKGADDAILTFRVPNEQDAATTTKLDIKFPAQDPIASVKPAAMPGWVVTTTTVKFNPPIKTDDGTITQGVGEVSYTVAPGNKGIPIGGFGAFQILVGPLPNPNQSPTRPTRRRTRPRSWPCTRQPTLAGCPCRPRPWRPPPRRWPCRATRPSPRSTPRTPLP